MILIAESGSFKTHWRILKNNKETVEFNTLGLNPFFTGQAEISEQLINHFPPEINKNEISRVYFYGAGCGSSEKGQIIIEALTSVFARAMINIHTDLLAAARACYGRNQGIVVILGTGSNSGYYNGEKIISTVPSLGYILGDEGSGAQLGKRLLTAYLLDELPGELYVSFNQQYKLQRDEILYNLYSMPRPNRFLASFTPFLWWHRNHPFVKDVVENSFRGLIDRYLSKYPEFTTEPIRCTGSVAHFFAAEITSLIARAGGKVDCILQHPIDNLVDYHLKYE